MYLVIKHTGEEVLSDDRARDYLSAMVNYSSGIADSSKLLFWRRATKTGLEIWELPDNAFTPKLRGLSLLDVHPMKYSTVPATDISVVRYFKDAGADFANLWIDITGGNVSELSKLNVVPHKGEYLFLLSDTSIEFELQELLHNLENPDEPIH